jgi:hypothetical protein
MLYWYNPTNTDAEGAGEALEEQLAGAREETAAERALRAQVERRLLGAELQAQLSAALADADRQRILVLDSEVQEQRQQACELELSAHADQQEWEREREAASAAVEKVLADSKHLNQRICKLELHIAGLTRDSEQERDAAGMPNATIYVSLYYCICVLILLYVCPHTTIYVSSYSISSVALGMPMRSCSRMLLHADVC